MTYEDRLRLHLQDKGAAWRDENPGLFALWQAEDGPQAVALLPQPLTAAAIVDAYVARPAGARLTLVHVGPLTPVALRSAARFGIALLDAATLPQLPPDAPGPAPEAAPPAADAFPLAPALAAPLAAEASLLLPEIEAPAAAPELPLPLEAATPEPPLPATPLSESFPLPEPPALEPEAPVDGSPLDLPVAVAESLPEPQEEPTTMAHAPTDALDALHALLADAKEEDAPPAQEQAPEPAPVVTAPASVTVEAHPPSEAAPAPAPLVEEGTLPWEIPLAPAAASSVAAAAVAAPVPLVAGATAHVEVTPFELAALPWHAHAPIEEHVEVMQGNARARRHVDRPTLAPAQDPRSWGLPWPRPVPPTDGLSIADPRIWHAQERVHAMREDLDATRGAASFGAVKPDGSAWLKRIQTF